VLSSERLRQGLILTEMVEDVPVHDIG